MPTPRYRLMCWPVRRSAGGRIENIIAAGRYKGPPLPTVEVYDLSRNTWTKGENLPEPLGWGAVVPYEESFLIVGGDTGRGYSDKVYLYMPEADDPWREMPHMKLSEPKSSVAATMVSSSIFRPHQ